MDAADYYRRNATYIEHADTRLNKITELVGDLAPVRILDVGCGTGWLADLLRKRTTAHIVGLDVLLDVRPTSWQFVVGDVSRQLPFRNASFDCVVAGEIIEHVADPDALVRELHRTLIPGGHLLISSPNMVSWANRLLVPIGIQPLGTETSSEIALGRRLRVLGQGNQVQGHLKVFSYRALAEILERYGFRIRGAFGLPAEFPSPFSSVDRFFTRFVPVASDVLYLAQAEDRPCAPTTPRRLDPRGRK